MAKSLTPKSVDFKQEWPQLKDKIISVVNLKRGVKASEIYEDVYRLCTSQPQSHSETLYNAFKQTLREHVQQVLEVLEDKQSDVLSEYLKKWKEYNTGSTYNHRLMDYLNRNWIKKKLDETRSKMSIGHGSLFANKKTQTVTEEYYEIYTLSLRVWKEGLFDKIKVKLIRELLLMINKEREGDLDVNKTDIHDVILSFIQLGLYNPNNTNSLYKEDFEFHFLDSTKQFYSRESSSYIANNGVALYMSKALIRLKIEEDHVRHYLDSSSFNIVEKTLNTVLIETHKDIIISECEHMLIDHKDKDLNNMYLLLKRIPDGLLPMLTKFHDFILKTGLDDIKTLNVTKLESDQKKNIKEKKDNDKEGKSTIEVEKVYIESLLKTYNTFFQLVRESFNNDPSFISCMDKACRKVVNENSVSTGNTKSPEYLAKYSDLLLKKGNKFVDENLLESKLSQIILVFKYIDDKDVFQKYYSKLLSRRLIHGLSISDDAEKFMITGLREACGYEYTSKLQRMFGDIQLASETNENFKNYLTEKDLKLNVDFNFLVLTAGSWPLQGPTSNFIIPNDLNRGINEFSKFYEIQHHGRKLNWLHNLCKADLKMELKGNKRYEVQTTSYQMGILLLYNNGEKLTVSNIQTLTNLSETELKDTLKSLLFYKLLLKKSQSDDEAEDLYMLNETFVSKRKKFKITTALQSENEKQNAQTRKVIEDDRKLFLQATIVRVMKSRKVLRHNLLIQEVIEQSKSRFHPSIPIIKKCIEQLIEKEYLERKETEEYSYVA